MTMIQPVKTTYIYYQTQGDANVQNDTFVTCDLVSHLRPLKCAINVPL